MYIMGVGLVTIFLLLVLILLSCNISWEWVWQNLYNIETIFWFIANNQLKVYSCLAKTSKGGTLHSPSDVYVRSFLCSFSTVIKCVSHKSSEWSSLSLILKLNSLLQRSRIRHQSLQAITLEWFGDPCSAASSYLWPHGLGPIRLLCPWDFPGKKHWSGLPFPAPGDLLKPGIKQASLVSLYFPDQYLWRRKWQPIPAFLPGEISWTEEPGRLLSHVVAKSWAWLSDYTHIHTHNPYLFLFQWNRKIFYKRKEKKT